MTNLGEVFSTPKVDHDTTASQLGACSSSESPAMTAVEWDMSQFKLSFANLDLNMVIKPPVQLAVRKCMFFNVIT
jgi:hypothetical protein